MALWLYPEWQLSHPLAAMAAAFIPYGVAAWLVVGLILVTAPRWWVKLLAVVAAAAAVVQLSWCGHYWPRQAPAVTPSLTVMTLNTYYGWADVAQLVAEVERTRPDVVVLAEVTQMTWDALRQTRWPQLFPHRLGEPAALWHSDATMVFSSHPLTLLDTTRGTHEQQVVRVGLPSGPVVVIAAHPTNPTDSLTSWVADLEAVGRTAQQHGAEPVVIAGDLNAVREHLPMQRLLQTGLADAREQSGAGWQPTFPTQLWAWLQNFPSGPTIPALIAMDHVLVNPKVIAVSVSTFGVDGTDHLGIVARLKV